MNIGRTIKRLRQEKGVTQEKLGDAVGVTCQAVSKWETGTALPDICLLPGLAEFLGVTIDDLFSIDTGDHLARIDSMLRDDYEITPENFVYATSALNRMIEVNPDDTGAMKRLYRVYDMRRNRDSLVGLGLLERVLSVSPFDQEAHMALVLGRRMRLEHDGLIRFYERHVGDYPDWQPGYRYLASAYIDARNPDMAIETIQRGLALGEDLGLRLLVAEVRLLLNDAGGAKALWERLLEEYPNDPLVYEAAAKGHVVLEEYDEALRLWGMQYDGDPSNLSPLYESAFLCDKTGEYRKAIHHWRRIIEGLAEHHGITGGETVEWPRREMDRLLSRMDGGRTAY